MTILITGGTGFIGRNLVEYYAEKMEVLAPGRKELDLLDEDAVREYFRKNRIRTVIHSATHPGHRNAKDPTNVACRNLRMFFNIVRNAERYEKLIFLSSGSVYDMRHYTPKMREEYFDVHVPVDEHGFSKYISARHIEAMENAVELRLFGVFGKHEDYAIRFISNAICKALFDLPITIRQNRRFDYLFIDDLGPIVDYFVASSPFRKAYNVTPDASIELLDLARKVLAVAGKDLPVRMEQPGMGPEYSGSNACLRDAIPSLSLSGLDSAISGLYRWYENNRESIQREFLLVDK
jgi:UDP-glucose 4-epimerase